MTWVKLVDTFPEHPKVLEVGDSAAWLYVAGLCYCSRHLTDGFIPRTALSRLTTLKRPAYASERLVNAGLWMSVTDGWVVHDYVEHQATKQQVEAQRDAARERQRRHRSRVGHAVTNADVTEPDTEKRREEKEQDPRKPEFSEQVRRLTRQLASGIQGNGHKVPAKGTAANTKWLDAVDKLLRIDKAEPSEVERVIAWTVADEFWSANMQSAPTFRKRYSQLRGNMLRGRSGSTLPTRGYEQLDRNDPAAWVTEKDGTVVKTLGDEEAV